MAFNRGKYTCDRSVGSPSNGWHDCGETAVAESVTECVSDTPDITLHWCEKHMKHIGECGFASGRFPRKLKRMLNT